MEFTIFGKFGWFVCLIYVVCVALRLARFNVHSDEEPSWKDNFFEGMPSPAGGIIVLMPLILSFSGFGDFFKINYDFLVPIFFVLVSILLISTIPTYSFKKIVIQRSMTKFLLFGIVIFFGALLVYAPFKILLVSSLIYLCLIPISYFHYKKLKKKNNVTVDSDDGLEDIL